MSCRRLVVRSATSSHVCFRLRAAESLPTSSRIISNYQPALVSLSPRLTPFFVSFARAEFQPQSSPLHPPHLLHAFLMLMALKRAKKNYIAIYNCGEKSGASQKRRQ